MSAQLRTARKVDSRSKGSRYEREAYHWLADSLGSVVRKRELGQARDGGCDLWVGPWAIEVKARARVPTEAEHVVWRSQVERVSLCTWAVVYRSLRRPWRVRCRADALLNVETDAVIDLHGEDWVNLVREGLK